MRRMSNDGEERMRREEEAARESLRETQAEAKETLDEAERLEEAAAEPTEHDSSDESG